MSGMLGELIWIGKGKMMSVEWGVCFIGMRRKRKVSKKKCKYMENARGSCYSFNLRNLNLVL